MGAFDSWGVTSSGGDAGSGNERGQRGSEAEPCSTVAIKVTSWKGLGTHEQLCSHGELAEAIGNDCSSPAALQRQSCLRLSQPCSYIPASQRELRIILIISDLEMVKCTGSWAAPRQVPPRAAQGAEARACDASSGPLRQGVSAAEERSRARSQTIPPKLSSLACSPWSRG